jgi:hypothetical protein
MSGPIVRTGTTPEYWKNWDNAFGKSQKVGAVSKKSEAKAEKKAAKKAAAKKAKKSK